jgi:hypothetical protein
MATVSWSSTLQAPHIALSGTATIGNNTNLLGSTLNPSGFMFSTWDLFCQFHVAPTAGGYVDLYLLPSVDDITFSAGGTSVTPPSTAYIGTFPTFQNANSGMHLPLVNIPLTPLQVKPLIRNVSGQTIPANSGTLTVRLYNEVVS